MLKKTIIIVCLISAGVIAAGYILLYTSLGKRGTVKYISSQYGDIQSLEIDPEGNIGKGVTLKDIELTNLKGFPAGSRLKVQELFVQLKMLSLDGLVVRIENARLLLPESDPILVLGTIEGQTLDLDIFSRGVTVREVVTYLPDLKALIPLKGGVDNVDFYIRGSFRQPKITGNFEIKEFIYQGFVLNNRILYRSLTR